MFCDDCKKQPAVVHLVQIVNGQKSELHLCLSCATRRNIQVLPVPFAAGLEVKPTIPAFASHGEESRRCASCGYTWQEFTATSFFGCTSCYQYFGDLLGKLIVKNQGNVRHQGKYPQKGGGPLRVRREISALRNQLEKAVQEENFEKAANLRDKIHHLEQQQVK